jgi:geranylgeranyl pyrophosphate synthase
MKLRQDPDTANCVESNARKQAEATFSADKHQLYADRIAFIDAFTREFPLKDNESQEARGTAWDEALRVGLEAPARAGFKPSLSSSIAYWIFRNYRGFDADLAETTEFAAIRRVAVVARTLLQAALIIDDIEDGGTERYGRPAHYVNYGIPLSVNSSSWAIMASLRYADHPRAVSEFINLVYEGFVGQAVDIASRENTVQKAFFADPLSTRRHFHRTLIRLKARLGLLAILPAAAVLEVPDTDLAALTKAMETLGLPIQIYDEITDLLPVDADDRMKGPGPSERDLENIRVNNIVCLEVISRLPAEERTAILEAEPAIAWQSIKTHPLLREVLLELVESSRAWKEEAGKLFAPLFRSEESRIYFEKAMADNHMDAVQRLWDDIARIYKADPTVDN